MRSKLVGDDEEDVKEGDNCEIAMLSLSLPLDDTTSSVTSIRLTPGIIDANRVLSGAQICSRGFLRSGYPGTLRRDYFATANDHDDTCDELDEGSAYPF